MARMHAAEDQKCEVSLPHDPGKYKAATPPTSLPTILYTTILTLFHGLSTHLALKFASLSLWHQILILIYITLYLCHVSAKFTEKNIHEYGLICMG